MDEKSLEIKEKIILKTLGKSLKEKIDNFMYHATGREINDGEVVDNLETAKVLLDHIETVFYYYPDIVKKVENDNAK